MSFIQLHCVNVPACQPADVILSVDTSSLPGPNNFYQFVVPFARALAAQLNLGPDQTQFGFETFNNSGNIQFYLGSYQSSESAVNAISPYYGGGARNTAEGINVMTGMMTASRGARTDSMGVNRIGVILTYGASVSSTNSFNSAVAARNADIKLLVVAVNVKVGPCVMCGLNICIVMMKVSMMTMKMTVEI